MTNQTLIHLYEEFLLLPFPQLSHEEDCIDWISKLTEIEGFYVGLAATLIKGDSIKVSNFPSLAPLFKDLKQLRGRPTISKNLYQEYEHYLLAFDRLVKEVQASLELSFNE